MKNLCLLFCSLTLFIGCDNEDNSSNKEDQFITNNNIAPFISQRELHEQQLENNNFQTEDQWDSLNNTSPIKIAHKKGTLDPDTRTFGWHMYSHGTAYKNYNYSMLWGVSYFSYFVDPKTGSYKKIHQWKTTSLIDSAKVYGCKVFLSVANFGSKNNAVFLENRVAQNTLIDSLSSLLTYRNANGINIDFEGVDSKNKTDFTKFIILISKNLKEKNPNYMVSLCLYANDWNDVFDIKALNPHIDFYTLMAYDYYGSFSKTAGPVTPFKNSKKFGHGLERSVKYYKKKGVNASKLIVGLPYYGAEWYTSSSDLGSTATRFKSHPPYKSIKEIYIDSLHIPVQFDPKSSSSYLVIKDHNNAYRQIYFEDKKSLGIKYDWIKKNNIGGVGIWALGYDDGYTDLWELLSEKFSKEQNASIPNQ